MLDIFWTLAAAGVESFEGGATTTNAQSSISSSLPSIPSTMLTFTSTPTLGEAISASTNNQDYDPFAPWTDIPYATVPSILPEETEMSYADMKENTPLERGFAIFIIIFIVVSFLVICFTSWLCERERAANARILNTQIQLQPLNAQGRRQINRQQPANRPTNGTPGVPSLMGTTIATPGPSHTRTPRPRTDLQASESLVDMERALLRD